jgi:multidrug resistance efflux pump
VAHQSLEAARAYLQVTEEAVERVGVSDFASTAFRVEVFRERAAARKAVVSQEAEAAEASAQIAALDTLSRNIQEQLDQAERRFAGGRVSAPIAGIIPTKPARDGQSLVAGSPIAEIRDPTDIYIYWYFPNDRLRDPEVGNEVAVLFGHRRMNGKVTDILPLSDVVGGMQAPVFQERTVSQVARIRVDPGVELPPLNSRVVVHMHYTVFTARIADMLIWLFGLDHA